MKIGIYGYGIVGRATELMLRKFCKTFFTLIIYDIKIHTSKITDLSDCDYIFICLPTPQCEDGTCNTLLVYEAVEELQCICSQDVIIVIRSTVPPGTTRSLQMKWKVKVVFMPEFLTESTYEYDAKNPQFIVIGNDIAHFNILELFINNSNVEVNVTDSVTAELLKYSMNCLFATKVIFANSMYDIANKVGANWDAIKDIMYQHPWVGANHLDVMHKGFRGYSGKCLPKDTKAIAYGFDNKFLKVVDKINEGLLKGDK
jgi:UDPglucose 6-dehydrogenase